MPPTETNFFEIRDRLVKLLHRHEDSLSAETIEAVEHYIAHDEYEVALEGLCLDLMEERLMEAADVEECVELGEVLGLNDESVLRDDFWTLLMEHWQLFKEGAGPL